MVSISGLRFVFSLVVVLLAACNSGNSSQVADLATPSDQSTEQTTDLAVDLAVDSVPDIAPDVPQDVSVDVDVDDATADIPDVGVDAPMDLQPDGSDAQPDLQPDGASDINADIDGQQDLGVDTTGSAWVVSTLAGNDTPGHVDGVAAVARFDNPVNVLLEPSGDLLVSDYNNAAVRRVTPSGSVSTLWNLPNSVTPFGLVLTDNGFLYVHAEWDSTANDYSGSLWMLDPSTGNHSLVIDNSGQKRGMALLADGRIVMTDFNGHMLTIYDPVAKTMNLLTGAAGQPAFKDGLAASARFNAPHDIVVTPQGFLLVADMLNNRIRRVQVDGKTSTFAGDGVAESLDGTLATARFNQPTGLAVDSSGAIFVNDAGGYVIRHIVGDQVTTIAGDGTPGYVDGPALQARFFGLEGIDVTADGTTVYIADGNLGESDPYHRIRTLSLQP